MAHAVYQHYLAMLVRSIKRLVATVVRASVLMCRQVAIGKLVDGVRVRIAAYRIEERFKTSSTASARSPSPLYEYT